MLKESILFVASTGLLIYFMAPSNEPAEAEAAEQAVSNTVKTTAQTPDHAWDSTGSTDVLWGDEDEPENENFTFGDPTTVLGDEGGDRDQKEKSGRSLPAATSPGPGQEGTIYNPITMAPTDRPDPDAR